MARWDDVVKAEADFAEEVAKAFDAFTHKTMATLRSDGSPRISGTESKFVNGDLWFGSMPGALKARDLLRDPRFAMHGGTGTATGTEWPGDAKISGRAVEIVDAAAKAAVFAAWGGEVPEDDGSSHMFRGEIEEVVFTALNEAKDGLVVRVWTAARGLRTIERK